MGSLGGTQKSLWSTNCEDLDWKGLLALNPASPSHLDVSSHYPKPVIICIPFLSSIPETAEPT